MKVAGIRTFGARCSNVKKFLPDHVAAEMVIVIFANAGARKSN
jgi:hypothetical protein